MKRHEMRQPWQHGCKLILTRAPVEEITRQLSLALFMDAALDSRASALGNLVLDPRTTGFDPVQT